MHGGRHTACDVCLVVRVRLMLLLLVWCPVFWCTCLSDNVEARQWLNAKLVKLVSFDEEGRVDPDTVIPAYLRGIQKPNIEPDRRVSGL